MKRDNQGTPSPAAMYAFGVAASAYWMLSMVPIPQEIVSHAEVFTLIVGAVAYLLMSVTLWVLDAALRHVDGWLAGRSRRLNRHERELIRSGRKVMAAKAYRDRTGCSLLEAADVIRAFDKEGVA